jgi:release factor glutamine methyltransferase
LLRNFIRKIYFFVYYGLYHRYKLKKTVTEKIGRFTFTVYPTVFNPKDYFSSGIFAKFILSLDNLTKKYILDMGCGSGVVSVFAASKGAKCLAVDVNPVSVKSAEENAKQNGYIENVKAVQSNLFENILPDEKFDIIFFNPPYYAKEPKTDFEKAFFTGEGFKVIKDFLEQSKNHFSGGGFIYFITSSDLKIDTFLSMLGAAGFEFNIVKKVNTLFETFYITKAFLRSKNIL